ncbi:DUF4105 domain-containing protein [Bacteriovorax sp. Seq25_V]|uniref:DUF7844 domain-containing protein n=1 Tax=Bacteriovorax sp. Seq25_V TaxID=1201288 RepID=UPI00038A135D|nr:DUF4105 domain-containing protein [Bacteriovorax sp. Seq25_V]EQC45522.1 PF13387 domain protein [Bacteriovorax sp. Seq25_V]
MKILKGLFAVAIASSIFASPVLKLDESSVSKNEIYAVKNFLQEVEEKIPDSIKRTIKEPLTIRFKSFDENKSISVLPKNRCEDNSNILYAQVNTFSRDTIKISKLFLPQILAGEESANSYNCGHGNYYKKAIATVLHEVAHIYDFKRIRSAEHRKNVKECYDSSDRRWRHSSKCNAVKKEEMNKKSVSGLYDFFKLANWQQKLFSKQSKNLSRKRSADEYEYENLEEHYAVNFEFFLMDENYKCKRPSYYNFFSKVFDVYPHENADCKINTKIILDDKKTVIDIDPKRVYRVDYLLASSGDALMSGFGHSMFRLIVCAPFRQEASEDCIKDKLYHVVLSYRANVTDIKSNAIKGVFGGYDSILYMLSLPNVIEEYTMGELRDLMSLPIELNEDEKRSFIHKVLETYWEYAGNYKFLSSNCASESHDLLQSAMLDHEIKYGNIIKPYSLMDEIIENGLSREDYFEDRAKAVAEGILFESDEKRLSDIKNELIGEEESDYKIYRYSNHGKKFGSNYREVKKKKDIKEIIESISTEKLKDIFMSTFEEGASVETKEKLQRLSILAQGVMNVRQHALDEEIGTFLEKLEKDEGELGKFVREWNEKRKNFRLYPNDKTYGIPLEVTAQDNKNYQESAKVLEEAETKLIESVKNRYLKDINDLSTLKNLINDIRTKTKIISMKLYLK